VENTLRIRPASGHVIHDGRSIPTADIELGGVPRGAVLILCEPDALTVTADEVGNRFAEHGYEATIADIAEVLTAGDEAIIGAVAALLQHVSRRDWKPEQVGVVAYGPAGRAALLAARALPIGAAVSAAAHLEDFGAEDAREVCAASVPWLGMVTLDDRRPGRIDSFRAATEDASSAYTEVIAYPHVVGAFYHDSREPVEHAAAFDSWQRTLEWLDLRVVPRPTPLALAWQSRSSKR
jgi:carboxymethylenebutenolidase